MSETALPALLEASGLTVGWGGKAVAEQVSLQLSAGQILVIAGPNGAGKSTLVKALARQLKPAKGTIKLAGSDIWSLPPRDFARKVSYVPQSLEPGQDLTVRELVALGRNPHQPWWSWGASADDRQAVTEAMEKTATWQLRDKYLSSLSGGERQRAVIAVALAQKPRCMLLDEPTAHLDFRHQLELVDILRDLRGHGLGIVLVVHDLNLMARLADLILLLAKPDDRPSRPACLGRPEQALSQANLRRVYGVEVSIVTDAAGQPVYLPTSSSQ